MGVGPERRRGALRRTRRPRQLERDSDLPDRLGHTRLLDHNDHLAGGDKLRLKRLIEAEHRLEATIVLRCELLPLLARALQEDALNLRVRVRPRRLELLLDQVLASHTATPRLPELRLERAERDPAVL